MFKLIDKILLQFSPCFNRIETFSWFVIIVLGMILRIDMKGLTSIINCMMIKPKHYESMMNFFRSNGFRLQALKEQWYLIINKYVEPVKIAGRQVLLGDHIKILKEGRYIPGVKKHHQDSENVGKSKYIFGHQHGMIGLLSEGETLQCIPTDIEIHGGTEQIEQMASSNSENIDKKESDEIEKETLTNKMSQMTETYVEFTKQKVILVLDAFFPNKNLFNRVNEFNTRLNEKLITIIVRAKSNFVGFEKQSYHDDYKIKLQCIFDKIDELFTKTEMVLYGKKETVYYYCVNLFWKPIDRKIKFVLVKTGDKTMILMCSDFLLKPEEIILAYTYRFKIEVSFKYLKHTLGGFLYHFWTKALPKLSRYNTLNDLSGVKNLNEQGRIVNTLRAIEVYTFLSSIAYGIMTIIALKYSDTIWFKYTEWMRTKSSSVPSLETVRATLLKEYYNISRNLSGYATLKYITKYMEFKNTNICDDYSDKEHKQVSSL